MWMKTMYNKQSPPVSKKDQRDKKCIVCNYLLLRQKIHLLHLLLHTNFKYIVMNGMKENNLKIKDTNSELDQFLQFKNHKHFHPSFHSNHTAQNTNANDGNRNSHPHLQAKYGRLVLTLVQMNTTHNHTCNGEAKFNANDDQRDDQTPIHFSYSLNQSFLMGQLVDRVVVSGQVVSTLQTCGLVDI